MLIEVPERLRLYLRQNFNSVSLLELLFLLKRTAPREWTAQEASLEMRTNVSYASSQLNELRAVGAVCLKDQKYTFNPDQHDVELIEELEALYHSHRSTVISFIYAQPIDNIRNFAEAFKIKKD